MLNQTVTSLCINSGGQTGVDRAALDVAMELGLEHGGWCPKGRKAEDGVIHPRYRLREADDREYDTRTRLNVQDTDGTLILHSGKLEGGTKLTAQIAGQMHKPLLVVNIEHPVDAGMLKDWLARNHITTLNIAGPRESKQPGIYQRAVVLLRRLLS
ncbi:MAG: putative molybdenum carrier protein [Gammaproteobacteria bacterium]